MKKSIIRITSFILILAIVLVGTNRIFSFKYSYNINDVYNFYDLKDNTVDVLFLGTSHAYSNINTGTLWDEYGMASCVFAGSEQAMWNTYYYLVEALKTQTPELIVLEAFGCTLDYDYAPAARVVQNTYGLKWSKNKLDAIKASVEPDELLEYVIEYGRYHTRYSELSEEDFATDINDYIYNECMGYVFLSNIASPESDGIPVTTERADMNAKAEKYYRMIIELAQENDIPITVIATPYVGVDENDQAIFNTAADIAAEYGVDFVNYNDQFDSLGLDITTDYADYSHLNYIGSPKFAKILGQYLSQNYTISDRREDVEYAAWQENADYLTYLTKVETMADSTDLSEKLEVLYDTGSRVCISLDGDIDIDDETVREYIKCFGISDEISQGVWYRENAGFAWSNAGEDVETYINTGNHDIYLSHDDDGNQVIIDGVDYRQVKSGINVVVFDNMLDRVVYAWGIDFDREYQIVNETEL